MMQHLQPNTTLQGGKYRIEQVLGQGGFGITYLARNTVFDIDVAIKEFFMKDENDRDGSSVTMPNTTKQELFHGQMEKFKKEAKRMFAIKNEHIVGVQDLFEENGTAYYVMDYVDGENLAERLKRTGEPMSEQEVRDILPQILDALKSIHDAGIWHLDLKPANLLIDKSGNVKLIDFGASKQLNAQKGGATTSTAISYTNGYAPREQMEQNYDKFGPWTDIYALGATLYNLLTNKRPPLPTDIDDDITNDKHIVLPLPNYISKGMRKLVLSMMQTNRNQRPQDIESLRLNLPKFFSNENKGTDLSDEDTIIISNESVKETSLENQSRGERRHKKIIVYFLLLILVISGIVYFVFFRTGYYLPQIENKERKMANTKYVTEWKWLSPLGTCSYNGFVDKNLNLPNGDGEAVFEDGRYYKGNFTMGELYCENALFKFQNGDIFEGEFRDNSPFWGKLIVYKDGSYFKGSFKNWEPDSGGWYDKSNNSLRSDPRR